MKKYDRRTTAWTHFGVSNIKSPASICFRGPNDLFVPGLIGGRLAGFVLPVCAAVEPIMPNWAEAIVIIVVARKRRQSWLISSTIFSTSDKIPFRRNASFIILVAIDEIVITSFYSCSACFTALWLLEDKTLGK